ncbi:DUF5694 domain-containing protein [Maricaulis salignorans]|uniref:DUF5694 domain-containing protein n=1 Tax=Maricaulis salignorans TaxID=144026 RepID=UPI003A8D3801
MLRQTAIIFMALAMSSAALAQEPPATEPAAAPEIMVLGTFHFTGGGSDYVNSPVVDYLSPERQAEIAVVLDRLEAFAPTRILVELLPEYEAEFNATYQQYRAGEGTLTVNERQQIGLALAARLGLDQVHAIDYASEMDFGGMFAAAEAAGQSELLADFHAFMAPIQAQMGSPDQAARPVLERLIETNSAEMASYHALYLLTAQMGAADNPVGAEQMQLWWGRNLHIFANIARLAGPGDRVLVVYGGGHKYLLDQFVDSAPNLVLVDPLAYLD